jgi:hypothetical protein
MNKNQQHFGIGCNNTITKIDVQHLQKGLQAATWKQIGGQLNTN